jgi:hypothetical protein
MSRTAKITAVAASKVAAKAAKRLRRKRAMVGRPVFLVVRDAPPHPVRAEVSKRHRGGTRLRQAQPALRYLRANGSGWNVSLFNMMPKKAATTATQGALETKA